MAADGPGSQELKTLQEELSTSQKERAAAAAASGAASANAAGSTADTPDEKELSDQLGQFADELKSLFDGLDKSISAHPGRSVIGAMLVGILIGRLFGRR
jgi:ElaB/YqjD/DUF883 family membrane-anchored ribosome-binding protein